VQQAFGKIKLMDLRLDDYLVRDTERILTPALLIYSDIVDANIRATLRMTGGDPNRWRPHIKTIKSAHVLKQLLGHKVVHFKCATTLELLLACETGAADILVAFPVVGANAARVLEIAEEFQQTRISVLIETASQAEQWRGTAVGVYIDVNGGMDRTGISEERTTEISELATIMKRQLRGLHYYDGNMSSVTAEERETQTHAGYARLMHLVETLAAAGIRVEEVVTSGTPSAPYAISFPGFLNAPFVHRISPGTIVFNDLNSLKQLPGWGYAPAAVVLSTIVSHPTGHSVTCDAGHKSVSADSGVPTCAVIGHPELTPAKPSEEHLPINVSADAQLPAIGEKLYLLQKHVCPSVNNFDEALLIVNGAIQSVTPIGARGHESPLAALAAVR
jgi:D-serine deaminase-like pyridoxal phosphate-dependent protein